MTVTSRYADQRGRVPVGALLTILVLVGTALGAWWLLQRLGVVGAEEVVATSSPRVTAAAPDARPVWLADSPYDLPAMVNAEVEGLPPHHLMQDWVWEFVDDTWTVTLHVLGEGDGGARLVDVQALYLSSPTGEDFSLTDNLRRDYVLELVHWEAQTATAWLARTGRPGQTRVVQMDLVTLLATDDWLGSVAPAANRVANGVVDVEPVGDQPDGRELWLAHDSTGRVTGMFWRHDDQWQASSVGSTLSRAALQGFAAEDGLDAWIDVAAQRAVYHGAYYDPAGGEPVDEIWITHDLGADIVLEANVMAPSMTCSPVPGPRSGVFEGAAIVADCDGVEYLLDPYDNASPRER